MIDGLSYLVHSETVCQYNYNIMFHTCILYARLSCENNNVWISVRIKYIPLYQ